MTASRMGELARKPPTLAAYLGRQTDVTLAYIFGSYARGDARAQSDLDIALLLDEQERTPFELLERRLDLAGQMEEIVRRPVDVVLLNRVSLLLQGQVLSEGRLLYAANQSAQAEYESRARALYFDFQPRLRQHQEMLIQFAKEGRLGRTY